MTATARIGACTSLTSAAVLIVGAISHRRPSSRVAAVSNVAITCVALGIARGCDVSWAEMGIDPKSLQRGARVGVAVAVPVTALVIAARSLPVTRGLFADDRVVALSKRAATFELLVRIPVATAACEELLFRGVLLGMTSKWLGSSRAALWTSAAFGAWHSVSALHAHGSNAGAARLVRPLGGRAAMVAVTVAATTIAGAAFAALRTRTKSILAPTIVHAALNAAAFAATRTTFEG